MRIVGVEVCLPPATVIFIFSLTFSLPGCVLFRGVAVLSFEDLAVEHQEGI